MQNILILLHQLVQMMLYICIGYVLCRTGLVNKEGSKALSSILLYVVLPCVIVNSLLQERNAEQLIALGVSFLLAVVTLCLAMLCAGLIFRKRPIDNFSASFSNAGFMGIPLVSAMLGTGAVRYVAGMVALLNILQWTYGQWLMTRDRKQISLRACLTNPMVLAFLAGLFLFFTQLPLPGLVKNTITAISACNAPLAMIVLGALLGQGKLSTFFTDKHAWICVLVRLLLIPVVTLLVFLLVPERFAAIRLAVFLTACAPIGSNVSVYAQKAGLDAAYASRSVCLSTLLSVITMPLMIGLAEWIW